MAEHSNLPAPYASPWRQLGQALRAVAASLRLDLRSLWRRNRVGELPRPSWWPRDLTPLFWPLLLAGCLALLTASLLTVRALEPAATEPTVPTTPQATLEATPEGTPESGPAPAPAPAAALPPVTPPAAPPPAPDPLLRPFAAGKGGELIVTVEAKPAAGLLQLVLNAAFEQLEPQRQRQLAEAWLDTSLQLGFTQLELIDARGQRLGYQARVGSGMILLDPNRDR